MKIIKKAWIFLFLAIYLPCPGKNAAEDILKRHIRIMAGRSDITKIETMVVRAIYSYPDTGNQFEAVFYWKRPNLSRAEFRQKPKQVIAFDGQKAWTASLDPDTDFVINSQEMPDSSPYAANYRRAPGFEEIIGGPPLNYKSMGIAAVFVGVVAVDGLKAHNLCLTWPDGFAKNYFFNSENGFLIFEEVKDQKGLIHTSRLSDHKDMGGLFLPCFRLNKGPLVNDKRIIVHQNIIELKTNVPLPDTLFIRPGRN